MKMILKAMLLCMVLSLALLSCSEKKNSNSDTPAPANTAPQEQTQETKMNCPEPANRIPGHKYLNGRDLTNSKQTCTMCGGKGKHSGKKCPECQGFGYILVYK